MKAILCKEWGPPETLVVEDVVGPKPGPGEVLMDVHAAGVNFPDTLIIQNKYQFKPDRPFSPGGEVAGIVKEIGSDVTACQVGDRVIGTFTWGGFATEAVVVEERIVHIPDAMDFTTASAYVLAYGTVLYALKERAALAKGETLLVLGAAGGTGIAAIELGKAMGAQVIAAASTAEKLELCLQHGADHVINYEQDDLREKIKSLTDGKGIDVIFDPVGGSFSETAFRSIAYGGRHLVVGFAAGDVPRLPLNLPLLKSASIVGVFWGAFLRKDKTQAQRHLDELIQYYNDGHVQPPVTKTYRLDEVPLALRDVIERRVTGKLVILPRESIDA
ncbi:NADPH:quinone oxidoreductase family protein [Pusillimonas sp. MFBS29]|uniref:NADPH:quinone oxidoreductase family protein n=1 Tax=Pusillimonas sp. MFBS29 TaxID=2886690 RepID=UPI001D101BF3|nr:NADPH:quinone oxidoreductase family protein [Pusillimonas sp. MFBS29]MCC2595894.1 NADPH:quinone oxidoreductase family protein [Pusillimonas sp. MFBS29]